MHAWSSLIKNKNKKEKVSVFLVWNEVPEELGEAVLQAPLFHHDIQRF